jgi:hypothetical protein
MAASNGTHGVRLLPYEDVSERRDLRAYFAIAPRQCVSGKQHCGRTTEGEFKQFLSIAQGSTYEVQTQLLMALKLKIGDEGLARKAESLCIETSKMLGTLIGSLGKKAKG